MRNIGRESKLEYKAKVLEFGLNLMRNEQDSVLCSSFQT